MHTGNTRQTGEMPAVKLLEIGGVGNDHTQQVIVLAGHQITLHHMGHFLDRLFEGLQIGLLLAPQRNVDEHIARETRFRLIEHGHVTFHQAGGLQGPHPSKGGRFRKADPFRQFDVADSAVMLEHTQDGMIVAV